MGTSSFIKTKAGATAVGSGALRCVEIAYQRPLSNHVAENPTFEESGILKFIKVPLR